MNESLHLYLTGQEALLRMRGGWPWRPAVTELAAWPWSPGAGPLRLPAGTPPASPAMRWGRRPLHVVVDAALCRLGVFDLPDGAQGPADVEAISRARLAHDLDLDAAQWRFACDHDRRRRKVVVCAVRAEVHAAVAACATAQRLRLASLRPFAAVLANATLDKAPARRTLLAVEAGALSVIDWDGGAVAAARSMPHDGQPHTLPRAVQRIAFNGAAGELALLADRRIAWDMQGVAAEWLAATRLRHSAYADFRDLMFRPEEATCA